MAIDKQYTVYHLHSDLSNGVTNIDSVTKYGEYIEKAKELGMKAMAFSEHGSVFEWWHKKSAIEAAGMKPGKDIIIVDCGLGFPEDDMYGVDLVIADMTYLVKNQNRIRVPLVYGAQDVVKLSVRIAA